METRPIIDLYREATPEQMSVLMDGVEDSLDHVVGEALVPDRAYYGMVVTVNGSEVTVGTGHYWSAGKIYAFDTPETFDVLKKLPQATKRKLVITVRGTEADTDVKDVNVLDPAASTPSAPVYRAQALATTHKRVALMSPAYGDESPNPPDPDVGLALAIAKLTLTPAGIVIQPAGYNLAAGKGPVLADLADRVTGLKDFEARIDPQVSTLTSGLAALANSLKSAASSQLLTRMLVRLADLDAKVGIPSNAADSSADYLLTDANIDLTHPLTNCRVFEGIRFAADGDSGKMVLDLYNPFEQAGVVKGGVLLPAYERYLRRTTGAITGSVRANAFTYNPVSYVEKTMTRSRVRYGSEFSVCTNSAYWNSGQYDPITGVFRLSSGETFKAAVDIRGLPEVYTGDNHLHMPVRLQQFWTDTISEPYWDHVVQPPKEIPGFHLFESELIGQSQWIDAVGFTLTKLDKEGDITVVVVEAAEPAEPKPASVLALVHVPYANLVQGKNVAALTTPILVTAGKRISYGFITTAAHELATTDGASFPQGTFFVLAPSGYVQGDTTRHLALDIYGCRFGQSVTTIQLMRNNLQLAGGITAIDLLAGTIIPASTGITYSVQIAGKLVPLSGLTADQLNAGGAMPANLPLFVTFAGTPDMQPALNLAESGVRVTRPKTTLGCVWPKTPRTPPVATSQVRAIVRYEGFDAAQHTWGAKLLTGAAQPFLTAASPSSFSDVVNAQDGSLERTYVWNLKDPVTAYQILAAGQALTPLKVGHAAFIKDFVL